MPARLNGIQARQALQFAEEALRTAQEANEALQAENVRLRKELELLLKENQNLRGNQGVYVHGFRLQQKGNYWEAFRRIGKKLHCVYIGRDETKAESKILAYAERNALQLQPKAQADPGQQAFPFVEETT